MRTAGPTALLLADAAASLTLAIPALMILAQLYRAMQEVLKNVSWGRSCVAYRRRGAKLERVSRWRSCNAAVLPPGAGYVVVDALMALDAWCLMGA